MTQDSAHPRQHPVPGTRRLRFQGDLQTFTLTLPAPRAGRAFLRTNLGRAATARREVIRRTDRQEIPMARDWADLAMLPAGEGRFTVTVPLGEVGHFEAKSLFEPAAGGELVWPPGPNVVLNVAPAHTCRANIVYNAFVRQFVPPETAVPADPERERRIRELERAGYAVLPPSGTLRELARRLDVIVDRLGCRFIQLLPIFPTPTTYGRMGRFGSPYAGLSFTAVDPALAEFDPQATPLEQFGELVDAVHARQAYLLLDMPLNHTGWAAGLHESHPQWLVRDREGALVSPGAWGVVWRDLTKLDFERPDLWQFMAGVLLTWCRRGVDGFRCDAGYMIPAAAWRYMIARVREQYPATLFFLEGLGGPVTVTRDLLDRAAFDWAYSELFQNYDRGQIEHYLPEALEISRTAGLALHFAETHDNNRLAATSPAYARMRTALCALFSIAGAFGFANGVEWFATAKIDVHANPPLNWGTEPNQVPAIRRLTDLLKTHPAFGADTALTMVQTGEDAAVVLHRRHRPSGRCLLAIVNLDPERPATAVWQPRRTGLTGGPLIDLLTGDALTPGTADDHATLRLEAGQVRCLSDRPPDLDLLTHAAATVRTPPEDVVEQRCRATVLMLRRHLRGLEHIREIDLAAESAALRADPAAVCRRLAPAGGEPRMTVWQWPADTRREVPVPPGHMVLIRVPEPFRFQVGDDRYCRISGQSLPADDGAAFALVPPPDAPRQRPRRETLALRVLSAESARHATAVLYHLPPADTVRVQRRFTRRQLLTCPRRVLAADGRGAALRATAAWGRLDSGYDALLAVNPDPQAPPPARRILLTRCRAWTTCRGFSQELDLSCLDALAVPLDGPAVWRFNVPTGQGRQVRVLLALELVPERAALRLHVLQPDGRGAAESGRTVTIIVRPDIEDRDFHAATKAFQGPETRWPAAIRPLPDGFVFSPTQDRRLSVTASAGRFVSEPEWLYGIQRVEEAERGLEPASDLFSPGYFTTRLTPGTIVTLTAASNVPAADLPPLPPDLARRLTRSEACRGAEELPRALESSLDAYLLPAGDAATVLAGYPWFLDWGRDALIVARGLIATGRSAEALRVIRRFAALEENGTLPNMIRGPDASNRDTSDAPLWLFAAVADLLAATGDRGILDTPCGTRRLGQVLTGLAAHLRTGTANGIHSDPASGLLFSPAHFTWMDTAHPAATPRQGYPVEIQALWYRALDFLARTAVESAGKWTALATTVRCSLDELFWLPVEGYLCDCLAGEAGTPAAAAAADDALRPNQLFALTCGAVDAARRGPAILAAAAGLLVPGGVRSLADRPVRRPLPITHAGRLLNDPQRPYQGRYLGDEDTSRKPAYHNGTAWVWLLPSFCEAWWRVYGEAGRASALAWLASTAPLLDTGCIGHLPEILDGNAPHTPRGADAQAWSASETLRVWRLLSASATAEPPAGTTTPPPSPHPCSRIIP